MQVKPIYCRFFLEAERYDPVLSAAQHANLAAQEKRIQGEALLKPSIGLNGNLNQTYGNQTYYIPAEASQSLNYRQWNAAVNATLPLYRPGNKLQATQGTALTEQSELQLELTQQNLMLRVAQAYTDRRVAEETVDVLKVQKTAIERQLALAQKNFKVGNTTIVDTHEAQARYDQTEAQLSAAQLDVQNKGVVLENLIGRPIPRIEPLRSHQQQPPLKFKTLDEWLNTAQQQHPAMKLAEKMLKLRVWNIRKIKRRLILP